MNFSFGRLGPRRQHDEMAPATAVSRGAGSTFVDTLAPRATAATPPARVSGAAQTANTTPGGRIDSATAALAAARDATLLTCTKLGLRVGTIRRSRLLIEGLDLTARRGEFWCVLGANGAGKTTLLHTLAGLRAPDAGSLQLAGRVMAQWSARDAACLRGFLPQGGDALFGLSALQAVLLGRHPHSRSQFGLTWESDEDLAIAHAALQRLDLAELADREVSSLSGGERQRVALAALLAQDPLVYLLDEPLNHLDLRHQLGVMALLREQALDHGRLVMASVHDASLAARFATHALVIVGPGRCVAGPADEVLTDEVLSAALGHSIRRVQVDGQTLVVAM